MKADEGRTRRLHPRNPIVYRHFERKVKGEGKNAIEFYKTFFLGKTSQNLRTLLHISKSYDFISKGQHFAYQGAKVRLLETRNSRSKAIFQTSHLHMLNASFTHAKQVIRIFRMSHLHNVIKSYTVALYSQYAKTNN